MSSVESGNNKTSFSTGLHVVYGSRTRRGLSHPNEDRHAIATWQHWNGDAHLREQSDINPNEPYPRPETVTPTCMGSARKDTTLSGMGGTGAVRDAQTALGFHLGGQIDMSKYDSTKQSAYLWTVCDGHDGPEAADFVCRTVGDIFSRIWHKTCTYKMPANYLKDKSLSAGEDAQTFAQGYALSNVLARTYEVMDQSFKQLVCPASVADPASANAGGTGIDASTFIESSPYATNNPIAGSTAGSCVTSIFLSGNLLCCAGLGDCKAAILTLESPSNAATPTTTADSNNDSCPQQQFQVTWFSKEHRSNAPKERARIRARGGWFRHGRVGGVLEPTRTIGDFDVKASQPPGVLIATPEVRTFNVTKPAIVLIASDGVWDVMDASQLLRTLKKRRRLWRGVLSWLGAPVPEKRSIMNFGFRKRAKSKEGIAGILQLPTGGDLVAMADALVTRAHDLGSDDDCTCVCIYLRPATPDGLTRPVEADASASGSKRESDAEAEDSEDEEDEEDEEEEVEEAEGAAAQLSADSTYEYEKWRKPSDEAETDEVDEEPATERDSKEADDWTNVFPVGDRAAPDEEAPEIVEKARRRREERRAARERRRRSLEQR